jgi:hypothetical protein
MRKDRRSSGMRNWECGMWKEKREDRVLNSELGMRNKLKWEVGMRNAERQKKLRNAELGMRNVELKKVKCLIFISWSLSPTCCAIITS